MRFKKVFIIWSFLFIPTVVMAGWFSGPNDYNSCILEGMKGVTSDFAAKEIRKACRSKFPLEVVEVIPDAEVPEYIARKLEGKANNSQGSNYFKGTLFNGDSEWTVTSMKVRITNEKTNLFRDYTTSIYIKPMSAGEFIFEAYDLPEKLYLSWIILNAYGYKK